MGENRSCMIEKIEVTNYQSLKDMSLKLGKFTVIVGPSGHGKSALIRALKSLCFNQVGPRFIRHGQQKATVRLTFDGGQVIEWEKPKGKGATYTTDDQVYTRMGRAVPEDISNLLGIRQIVIDKTLKFSPQFSSQHDQPLLLTESSTLAARALAKLTKLSVLVEAQMDCRRDYKRAGTAYKSAEEEAERAKEQLDGLPNVKHAKNILERATKLKKSVDKQLSVAQQADEIAHDIAGSLLLADLVLPAPEEIESLEEKFVSLDSLVSAIQQANDATHAVDTSVKEADIARSDLEDLEKRYDSLVEELGACPMCGSVESWGHDHEVSG